MEIEAEAGAEKEVGASAGSKSKSKPVPKSKASDAWATAANAFLTAADFGEAWTQLVALWWVREKEFGFVGTRQGHSAKKRPKEVGDWVSRARNHTPIVANADDLGVRWWNWWLDINPIWRGTMRPLTRQTGGWASMDYRGQNGFLNVMMSLKWWRDALKEVSPDWEEAVGDVSWVLSEMRR
ncbi:hypothetical protein C8R46DRAFT_930984 [Mycena filopes]|nr:hypothetical protein C8R46DRAFT_930984 [Mycena filopes]